MRLRCFVSVLAFVTAVTLMVPAHTAGQAAETRWDPPRTPDGQPDITGYWSDHTEVSAQNVEGPREAEQEAVYGGPPTSEARAVVDPPDGKLPYQPWAAEKAKARYAEWEKPSSPHTVDPVARCFMMGVPRMLVQGGRPPSSSMRILQTPTAIVVLHEYGHHYRVIHLDDRPPLGDTLKLWMGSSRGRWEGNTLVVEVTNHNDKTRFDQVGNFHSDAMRITERWTFVDRDRIEYRATIHDPQVYTGPWTYGLTLGRNPPLEQWEHAACEGNTVVHVIFGLPFEHERDNR